MLVNSPRDNFAIRTGKLLPFCRQIQLELQKSSIQLCFTESEDKAAHDTLFISQVTQQIRQNLAEIKKVLKKKDIPASRLPLPSYRAFLWLSFLEDEAHLRQHLVALREFNLLADEVLSTVCSLNSLPHPSIEINIYCLPYIYQTKVHKNRVQLSIHEALIAAPAKIKKDLLLAAFKSSQPARKSLKKFCSSQAYYQTEELIRGGQRAQGSSPQGICIDLNQVFEKVNCDYFQSKLEKPLLSWSRRKSRRRLGTYSAQLDQVTINRTLDRDDIPSYVIEFILYHELLHKKVGVQRANSGKHNHTNTFKELEKRFKYYEEATCSIKKLLSES